MHRSPVPSNAAAWSVQGRSTLKVSAAPYTPPRAGEQVVRTQAAAVHPVDWLTPRIGRVAHPWLQSSTVLSFNLAGEVVEVGPDVTRLRAGDRVLALAVGTEKNRTPPAEGACQQYAVVLDRLTCPLPDHLTHEQGAVPPLGLFQKDQLALQHPCATPAATGQTLLIWEGSTGAGSNAVQLAVAAGDEVITMASPRNFDFVRALGACQVFGYHRETGVQDLTVTFQGRTLAGALSIASGSAGACPDVLRTCRGRKLVSLASPPVPFAPLARQPRSPLLRPRLRGRMLGATALLGLKARLSGIQTTLIWGGSPLDDGVGPLVFSEMPPSALAQARPATGRGRARPGGPPAWG